jgi:hypothetical protein
MGGNFAILNPCQKKWSDLAGGGGRARFCGTCTTHVHSISEYSAEEWNRLWRESNGHVCGMLARVTVEPARSRRAILLGAVLTAIAPLFGQSGSLRIRVKDIAGAVVPHANISVPGTDVTATTDASGEAVISGLSVGDSRISITVPGFIRFQQTVTIRDGEERVLNAQLQVPTVIGEVVQIDPEEIVAHGGSTLNTLQMPYSQTLDPPQPAPPQLQPKRAKRHWWQVFH